MEPLTLEQQIVFICKLMYNNFQIPARYINNDRIVIFEAGPPELTVHPLYPTVNLLMKQLDAGAAATTKPLVRSLNKLENYVILNIQRKDRNQGYILFGPSAYNSISDKAATGLMNDFHIRGHAKVTLRSYFASLPIIGGLHLLHAAVLLNYMVYGTELEAVDLLKQNEGYLREDHESFERHLDRSLSARRETTMLHHDSEAEKRLLEGIKEGRPEKLLELSALETEKLGILSKSSHLRSQKNLAIAGITLATRAAIEGGLHSEIAYTMSDLYIQHLEELHDIESVSRYRTETMYAFAERVKQNLAGNYSKAVAQCRSYIFDHIYEGISVEQLAERAGLHSNYLSQLFKKEVGIPLQAYITQEKVEEAKKLLSDSSLTLTDIYTRLNFYDQSHFTKVFKRLTGITPKQYRLYQR
ncbi:helix-turn-helix domain-containing protein [Paenibacillus sp. sgz302251]|uniref:helix-turn-helix domain-containing protein n=1 Tax=Paenibacillus sp. sgz302251 TaxID=3414493 RepID=UPI003C7DB666